MSLHDVAGGPPTRASASELRRSVSCMTSASNTPVCRSTAVAVRHTPLTAIESPSASSGASRVKTVSRTPPGERSAPTISPRSAISPVNIGASPALDPGRDQHVLTDALAGQRARAQRVGDLLDTLALQRVARGLATEDHRCEEQP